MDETDYKVGSRVACCKMRGHGVPGRRLLIAYSGEAERLLEDSRSETFPSVHFVTIRTTGEHRRPRNPDVRVRRRSILPVAAAPLDIKVGCKSISMGLVLGDADSNRFQNGLCA